jgi:hypothetical protein
VSIYAVRRSEDSRGRIARVHSRGRGRLSARPSS